MCPPGRPCPGSHPPWLRPCLGRHPAAGHAQAVAQLRTSMPRASGGRQPGRVRTADDGGADLGDVAFQVGRHDRHNVVVAARHSRLGVAMARQLHSPAGWGSPWRGSRTYAGVLWCRQRAAASPTQDDGSKQCPACPCRILVVAASECPPHRRAATHTKLSATTGSVAGTAAQEPPWVKAAESTPGAATANRPRKDPTTATTSAPLTVSRSCWDDR